MLLLALKTVRGILGKSNGSSVPNPSDFGFPDNFESLGGPFFYSFVGREYRLGFFKK